ncbi:MAG: hypothetical protein EP330_20460 [Deltaproteobacteria bacterium]|nr:MAG: hypothetical protein EP330_20460 [Deltaproteobacteria bacterium]
MDDATWHPPTSTDAPLSADLPRWIRDWALLGGLTGALAPGALVFVTTRDDPEIPSEVLNFVWTAGVLGLVSGAIVGIVLCLALQRVPRFARVSASAVLGFVVLGAWGATVSGLAAALTVTLDVAVVAMLLGAIAAVFQCGWVTPLYAWLAGRDLPRLWVVLGAGLITAPLSGLFGFGGLFLGYGVVSRLF